MTHGPFMSMTETAVNALAAHYRTLFNEATHTIDAEERHALLTECLRGARSHGYQYVISENSGALQDVQAVFSGVAAGYVTLKPGYAAADVAVLPAGRSELTILNAAAPGPARCCA